MEELEYLLRLNEIAKLGGNKLWKLYEELGSFAKVWEMLIDGKLNFNLGENSLGSIRVYNGEGLESNKTDQYKEKEIATIAFWNELYPSGLSEGESRALVLYLKGEKDVLKTKMAAVVGSRLATKRGMQKTVEVVSELVGGGYTIVSGLARGIDTVAHETAIREGGRTVAVLAHGLQMIYPPENKRLAEEIIKRGGALVSELPWGTRPEKYLFLARNRLMVGMSQLVVIIEAGDKSGTMASANWAGEMGKEVLAVPGSVGTDLLIGEGVKSLEI